MKQFAVAVAVLVLSAVSAGAGSPWIAWNLGLGAAGVTVGVDPPQEPEPEPEWGEESGRVEDEPLEGEAHLAKKAVPCPDCLSCVSNADCPGGMYCVNGRCVDCAFGSPCCPPCGEGAECVGGECTPCVERDECCGNPDPCCGITCDDGNACTRDACSGGSCTNEPIDCDDGNPCTLDWCDTSSGCHNDSKDCADSDPCTDDLCVDGECQNPPKNCDDGNPCTINYCSGGSCVSEPLCPPDDDPCTDDYCQDGQCFSPPKDCDDGNPCTADSCDGGTCVHTWSCPPPEDPCLERKCVGGFCQTGPKDCDDGNPCTSDSCVDGTCVNEWSCPPPEDPCQERKCVGGVCQSGAKDCDDGNACTTDSCSGGTCQHEWNCPPPEDPCVVRTCVAGACQTEPKDCDDGDPCTDDSCDNGTCANVNRCDDGNGCTEDLCRGADCAYRWLCDAHDPCTIDACRDGGCVHTAKECPEDGNPCTVNEHCDPVTGACVSDPKDCNDAYPCTTDSCDPATGACVNTPKECDDGKPCTTDSCDQATGECRHTNEPDGDGDDVRDDCDNCPSEPNPDQADCDGDGTGNVCDQTTVTLSACVTQISANTAFGGAEVLQNSAPISAVWDPPENEGTLYVKAIRPENAWGYLPESSGGVQRAVDWGCFPYCEHQWLYHSFYESQSERFPGAVEVVIGAKDNCGNVLSAELTIHVWSVFDYMSGMFRLCDGALHGHTVQHYAYCYYFIRWKYADVLSTTGGYFQGGPEFTTDNNVCCPLWPFCSAAACVSATNYACEFGALCWQQGENVAASIIGHELRHTRDREPGECLDSECNSYTWEFDHRSDTGISNGQVNNGEYLTDVTDQMNQECN